MTVEALLGWIAANREPLIASLLDGRYRPQPVRGVSIPKPGGGERQLGIPTVVDRLVQQAIAQILDPILDPTFSASSFGFRRGRSAHDALRQARGYVADGYTIVVDLDLEKFFDRVNHDILMSRLARRIGDKRLLRIVRRFLQAGMMTDGVCSDRQEGTPQGGPLSPLKRAKDRLREITHRGRGEQPLDHRIAELNRFTTGWVTYYRDASCRTVLRDIDQWLRRKLRCVRLKHCKNRRRSPPSCGRTVSGRSQHDSWPRRGKAGGGWPPASKPSGPCQMHGSERRDWKAWRPATLR